MTHNVFFGAERTPFIFTGRTYKNTMLKRKIFLAVNCNVYYINYAKVIQCKLYCITYVKA